MKQNVQKTFFYSLRVEHCIIAKYKIVALMKSIIVLVTAVTVIAQRASQMQQVYTRMYIEVTVNCLFLSLKAEPTAVYLPYIM